MSVPRRTQTRPARGRKGSWRTDIEGDPKQEKVSTRRRRESKCPAPARTAPTPSSLSRFHTMAVLSELHHAQSGFSTSSWWMWWYTLCSSAVPAVAQVSHMNAPLSSQREKRPSAFSSSLQPHLPPCLLLSSSPSIPYLHPNQHRTRLLINHTHTPVRDAGLRLLPFKLFQRNKGNEITSRLVQTWHPSLQLTAKVAKRSCHLLPVTIGRPGVSQTQWPLNWVTNLDPFSPACCLSYWPTGDSFSCSCLAVLVVGTRSTPDVMSEQVWWPWPPIRLSHLFFLEKWW